jgi:endonuclease/exonuclease/phosphatase family metal-dependent hydrolase
MKSLRWVPLGLISSLLALSCSSEGSDKEQFELRTATFNAALAPAFAPLVSERGEPLISALAASAAELDLLCVQEFWLDEHWSALRDSAASQLPNALRFEARAGSGTCSEEELGGLGQCLQTSCPDTSGEELVACATSSCPEQVTALNPGCLACVMNHISDDFSACVGEPTTPDPAIYGGSFDVGLLSRFPILANDTKELSSYFVRAGVLYAKLDVPGAGPVHAFCTHLGSPLDIVPYAGSYGSWHDEQQQQIRELLAFVHEKTQDQGRVVVLGDMNNGPAHGAIEGEWTDNYALLTGDRLENPYLLQTDAACTWCDDNSYHPGAAATLIDHILESGFDDATTRIERTYVEPVTLETEDGSLEGNLSDHYGLRGVIRSEPR